MVLFIVRQETVLLISAFAQTEMPDFADFVFKEVFTAATISLCGPYLISLNPDFVDNFAEYISCLPIYAKCYPRWLKPRAFAVRDMLLESYKRWHKHALDHSPLDRENEVLWDDYWGSRLMKDRYTYASKMSGMSADSIAAEDLGLLFASVSIVPFYALPLRSNKALFRSTSSNAVPAIIWFCIHIYQDAQLLARVRRDVCKAIISPQTNDGCSDGGTLRLDIATLCASPLLQSMFAETLRLYQTVALMRMSDQDFELDGWRFRKNRMIFLCSRSVHLNASLWNTGPADAPHRHYPIDEFWADRFLTYPNQEDPVAREPVNHQSPFSEKGEEGSPCGGPTPVFSLKGLENCWVPFGGGPTLCPGRTFAKNEMLASFAILSTKFDVELLLETSGREKKKIEPDMSFLSIGTVPPKGDIPFRIRRRK